MTRTEAQRKARAAYEKKQRRLVVTLYDQDDDIKARIERIESMGLGYAEYIRGLIRQDLRNRPL